MDTDYTIDVGGQRRPLEDWNREVQSGFIALAASAYFKDRRQEFGGTVGEWKIVSDRAI